MGESGSPEFAVRWKSWDMPLGPPICALRGRQRRTSDSAYSGWPTPRCQERDNIGTDPDYAHGKRGKTVSAIATLAGWPTPKVQDGTGGANPPATLARKRAKGNGCSDLKDTANLAGWPTPAAHEFEPTDVARMMNRRAEIKARGINGNGFGLTLGMAAHLAGWATPTAQDHSRGGEPPRPHDTGVPLSQMAALAGWASPLGTDGSKAPKTHHKGKNLALVGQALLSGPPSTSSSAGTPTIGAGPRRGALNPEHSRWLMGYPVAWGCCGATAMQSIRTRRRRSSKRTGKQKPK